MADTKNGGPAFPAYWKESAAFGEDFCQEGMSLRDYFASKAMQALIIRGSFDGERDSLAANAYGHADAMLKAREGR